MTKLLHAIVYFASRFRTRVLQVLFLLVQCKLSINASAQQKDFQNKNGGANQEQTRSICKDRFGGFVTSGNSFTTTAGGADFHVRRMDMNGNKIWERCYGGAGTEDGHDIIQTLDGGFLIAGYTSTWGGGSNDWLIVKIDSGGVFKWATTIGNATDDQIHCVKQLSDSSYVVAGMFNYLTHGSGCCCSTGEIAVAKFTKTGGLSWAKSYDNGATSQDIAMDIQVMANGDFLVAGGIDGICPTDASFLLRVNNVGTVIWSNKYVGLNTWFHKCLELSWGGILAAGNTTQWGAGGWDHFFIKTNPTGTVLTAKTYGGAGSDFGRGILFKNNSQAIGYVLNGFTSGYGSGSNDVYLNFTDTSGNWLSSYAYGTGSDEAFAWPPDEVINDGNLGYLIATFQGTAFGNYDNYVIRVGNNGNAGGCNTTSYTPTVTSPAITATAFALTTVVLAPTVTNPAVTTTVPAYAASTPCSTLPVELVFFNTQCATDNSLEIKLTWSTASEENNDFFKVERSADGIYFEPIGIVKGSGNSSSMKKYELTDDQLPLLSAPATFYYRLKQVDFDGQYEYSPVARLRFPCTENNEVAVLPNPSPGIFAVTVPSAVVELNVYSVLGDCIYHSSVLQAGQPAVIDISHCASGMYFLKVVSGSKMFFEKITISK